MRKVWKNGCLIAESEANYSIYDSALMFGDVVFEMTRTFNMQTFRLNEHFDRLRRSCEYLHINVPYEWSYLRGAYEDMIDVNRCQWREDDEIRGLINVSRGLLPMYAKAGMGEEGTNIIIANFPLRHVLRGKSYVYSAGVDVVVPPQRAIPHHLLDARIKSRSRQHYKIADIQASKINNNAMALLLDNNGIVSEGTGSNFFMVKDGKVYTPRGLNCLRGISRDFVLELCYIRMIDTFESDLTLYDIYNADEAFFTNTPFSIIPIRSIDGITIKLGEVTKKIIKQWKTTVTCDYEEQARRWDNVSVG